MADEYSLALFYDYGHRCGPVDDASGSFYCDSCGCRSSWGWRCACNRSELVLGTELGLAIQDCEGVQIGVSL
jgi:hypothetical protein